MANRSSQYRRVRRAFDRPALKKICEMHELDFGAAYPDLEIEIIEERKSNNFYYFADRGSDILFVAHLDTVVHHEDRLCDFAETAAGAVVHSGTLDDRLGAYIGLELLPKVGLNFDILLTVGEESGQSTAKFFKTTKEYNWVIEFDRKGTDVVLYHYSDTATTKLVRDAGAVVGHGSCSDISYLEHLGIKCFNWGTGYDGNYHSVKGYAYLEDTYKMVLNFMVFHAANKDTALPHEERKPYVYSPGKTGGSDGLFGGARHDGDTRYYGGKRQHWQKGRGWVDDVVGGGPIGYYAGVKRWDQALKVYVSADEKVTKVWSGGKEYPSYEAYYKSAHPDDKSVWVVGERYDSYDEYWAKNHPDEEMVLGGEDDDMWANWG